MNTPNPTSRCSTSHSLPKCNVVGGTSAPSCNLILRSPPTASISRRILFRRPDTANGAVLNRHVLLPLLFSSRFRRNRDAPIDRSADAWPPSGQADGQNFHPIFRSIHSPCPLVLPRKQTRTVTPQSANWSKNAFSRCKIWWKQKLVVLLQSQTGQDPVKRKSNLVLDCWRSASSAGRAIHF